MNAAGGAVTAAVALALIWSGGLKVQDRAQLTILFEGYGAIPRNSAGLVARILPITEILIGLAIVPPLTHRLGAVAAAALFAAMASVVALSLITGHVPTSCGCWGAHAERPPSWGTVLSALGLASAAAMLTFVSSSPENDQPIVYWLGLFLGVTCVLLGALAWVTAPMVRSSMADRSGIVTRERVAR